LNKGFQPFRAPDVQARVTRRIWWALLSFYAPLFCENPTLSKPEIANIELRYVSKLWSIIEQW